MPALTRALIQSLLLVAGSLLLGCSTLSGDVPPPWPVDHFGAPKPSKPLVREPGVSAAYSPPNTVAASSLPAPANDDAREIKIWMPPARGTVAALPVSVLPEASTKAAAPAHAASARSVIDPPLLAGTDNGIDASAVPEAGDAPRSGRQLAFDFTPIPAWRRATIPPGSSASAVGRMPVQASPGLTLGPGDTVNIAVLGRSELSATGSIGSDGTVTVALIGPVPVAGLSPGEAGEKIAALYRQQQYLVNPQVTVTVSDYQSQQLTVLGEVRNPGRFAMRTRLSVLDGLALSGGISDLGASHAYVLRPEDGVVTRYEVDLDALIQSGAGQQYFELLPGDSLVVPRAQLFYIYGEVKSPNAYKLKPGMTVIQALSLAGGLTDKGSDRRIDIRRNDGRGGLTTAGASLSDSLRADDVIYVRERLF